MSPVHTGGSFSSFRAETSAARPEPTGDVSADGDKSAAKPVGETETAEAPKEASRADQARPKGSDGEPLDDAEMKQIADLKNRAAAVRNHEMAHVAAGGAHVRGGPTYSFQTGPDGQRYAVAGEVSISTGKEASPEKSIAKAQVVRRAALAPAEPSGADRSAAAAASKMESSARVELREEKLAEATSVREDRADKAEAAQESQEAAKAGAGEAEEVGLAGETSASTGAQSPAGPPNEFAPRPRHIPAAYRGGAPGPRRGGDAPSSGGPGGPINLIA